MMYKLSYEDQNKIIKLKEGDHQLEQLKMQVPKYFPSLQNFQLYYLDEDQDKIYLTIQEDFDIFKEKKKSNLKIYLRKSENNAIIQKEKRPEQFEHSRRSQQTSFSRRTHSRIINQYDLQHKNESPLQDSRRSRQFLRQSLIQQRQPYRYKQIKREEVHKIKCSKCNASQIIGARYQCPFCLQFNLCEVCQKQDDHIHSLVKVKKANRAINYEQLRNHLNLQFPDQDFINKEKQIEQLRKKYDSLAKLYSSSNQKEKINHQNQFADKFKSQRLKFDQKFEQRFNQAKRQIGRAADSRFDKQSRSREKYNYEDYRSYYREEQIPLESQIQRRKRLLYPYSDLYRY